ncbi:Helix-turn-helix domain protein [Pseudobythopirellula maris]|uniref:Helix-turn-helix domain protein n=1 Tax=Pseudobythopirellula maris TaxID=2527991 RepID=A0A5C5ZHF9_9BACT|nr:helix-turn-helix domain-containing protein [Pseudobythopirellula maris]TWT86588.1 Helix-turn-helix domain protein [Pseudobythopirellula maris]
MSHDTISAANSVGSPHPTTPLLLTADQAAKALSISPRKLWSLTAGGEIPHVRIGRSVRYPADGLQAFVAAKTEGGEV